MAPKPSPHDNAPKNDQASRQQIDPGAGTTYKDVGSTGEYNEPYSEKGEESTTPLDGQNIVQILRDRATA